MCPKREKGFTLVELMVAVAVSAVLLGLGVPSFVSAMKNSRLSADNSALVGALFLARSEAVKKSGHVTVCARSTDTTCGTDWNNGWLVFTDNNSSPGDLSGKVDGGEEVLNIVQKLEDRTLQAIASVIPDPSSAAHSASRSFVRYSPRGSNNWSGGSFTLCDDRGAESARAVNLVLTGDIRKGRDDGTTTTPLNVYGNTVTCP